ANQPIAISCRSPLANIALHIMANAIRPIRKKRSRLTWKMMTSSSRSISVWAMARPPFGHAISPRNMLPSMVTIGASSLPDQERTELANIRRFEAAGFRAWPATSVQYDGTWAIRLTASHPSWRLNSINPLDPSDHHRLDERMERLSRRFRAYGRPPTFRLSPLAAPEISRHLDELGWLTAKPSTVMRLPLSADVVCDAMRSEEHT